MAAQHARQIAAAGTVSTAVDLRRGGGDGARELYPVASEQLVRPLPERIALLERVDRAARAYDPRIVNVMASLAIEEKIVLIANSAGELVSDRQPLLRLQVACIAEHEGKRHSASAGGGGRVAFDFLIGDEERALAFAREAARQAIVAFDAVDTPAGQMTVVLGPGWPGVLLH